MFSSKKKTNEVLVQQEPQKPIKLGLVSRILKLPFKILKIIKLLPIVLVLVLVLAVYLIFSGTVPEQQKIYVDQTVLENKILALETNQSLEFEDRELGGFVNGIIKQEKLPISGLNVEFFKNKIKVVVILENAIGSKDVVFRIDYKPTVEEGKIKLVPTSVVLGKLPLPKSLVEKQTENLNLKINNYISDQGEDLRVESIKSEKGKVVIKLVTTDS